MSPIGAIKIQKYNRDMMFVLQSTVSDSTSENLDI